MKLNLLEHLLKWKEFGVLDVISMLLSTVVPIIIMIITLIVEKKRANKNMKIQQKKHLKDIEETKTMHQEQIKVLKEGNQKRIDAQNEINRISIMPYLINEPNVSLESGDTLTIPFKNIGNGTATHCCVEYDELSDCICETNFIEYYCSQPFDCISNVIQENQSNDLKIKLKIKDDMDFDKENLCDRLNFAIKFDDMKMNSYKQDVIAEISFKDSIFQCGRIVVGEPTLQNKVE